MTENFKNFIEKFRVGELTIYESKYWVWTLRPSQPTVGCGVLSLKRAAEKLSEITPEEGADLSLVVKVIENSLAKAFPVKKMNYVMYMMVDYHVHYHIIPRYSENQIFNNIEFVDKGWPKPPVLACEDVDEETLVKMKEYIKSNLSL